MPSNPYIDPQAARWLQNQKPTTPVAPTPATTTPTTQQPTTPWWMPQGGGGGGQAKPKPPQAQTPTPAYYAPHEPHNSTFGAQATTPTVQPANVDFLNFMKAINAPANPSAQMPSSQQINNIFNPTAKTPLPSSQQISSMFNPQFNSSYIQNLVNGQQQGLKQGTQPVLSNWNNLPTGQNNAMNWLRGQGNQVLVPQNKPATTGANNNNGYPWWGWGGGGGGWGGYSTAKSWSQYMLNWNARG